MLTELHKEGIIAKGIHAIGHSLGAQILGYVGHHFIKLTNGQKIARITALDPAGPCFSDRPKEEQIRAGAADYVEVYHCDDGFLGTKSRFGDIDFYMNKGFEQPQCELSFWKNLWILKPKICSHKVCVAAWMSTVTHRERFPATQCDSYESFKQGKCSQNSKTIAGFSNPGTAKGTYYFSTKEYEKF
ncbi:lipase member H-like [Spodoptera litura]|uniref:Lipase member H-like n=1 Tax=Spodoptera litura TaxID=69820 RepID=A0A9J7EM10_SPOLT|nr:lipase member H-like [Spodoptera litura]